MVLAVVATLTSTPLNVYLYGGSTGKAWVDAIFAAFLAGGWQVFPASMTAEFISDISDKVITFFIAWTDLHESSSSIREDNTTLT